MFFIFKKSFVYPILKHFIRNALKSRKMLLTDIIKTREGTLRGQELQATSFSKKKYFAFQGIPYAQAPVGVLRFKDPKQPIPWDGVLEATSEAPSCPQKHVLLKMALGEEDNCLALNVYTPQLPSSGAAPKPVMVWIHGGGFTFGSGNTDLYDPDYWMERDVVIVTCNYRVGALGFLSLGTSEVPGNAGLKDQVMVLRWVRRNIAQFGGDPDNITLFGESAGAASIHYHMLSPMSRGLFHRAIMLSGSSLNNWAFCANIVERSFRLGELMGCTTENPHELLQHLQQPSALDIVKTQTRVLSAQDKQDVRPFPFTPCIEPSSGEGERFLTEHPRSLLQQGLVAPVPVIIGVNNKEGMLILNDVPHTDSYFKVLNSNMSRIIPTDLGLPNNAPDKIRKHFFGEKPIGWDTVSQYSDYYGDVMFYFGVDETIRLHLACAVAPVYCYSLEFDGELGLLSWLLRQIYTQCSLKGVCHADDVGYMFKHNLPGPPQLTEGSPEEQVISHITQMWLQFADSGDPNTSGQAVRWEPAVLDKSSWKGYLEITEQLAMVDSRIFKRRMEFWDNLLHSRSLPAQKL